VAQTPTTLSSVLKERWTDEELQRQFMHDDSILKRLRATKGVMIGKQAQTPVWNDLNSGGYTTVSAAGGAINAASNQPVGQAVWTLVEQAMPIELEFGTLNQSDGNMLSVISGKNLEITGALATIERQAVRQLVTNGDSIVAQCATANTTTVNLVASPSGTAYGYDAIVRNWLRPGALVDIGTTADTDALATATTVTAVAESASAPTITVSAGTLSTTAGTHFVYITNPNSTTAANPEMNGLRNLIATTGAVGSLNPATAGQEFWAASQRDTSTTVMSLDLLLNLARSVKQKSRKTNVDVWMSLKQQANLYSLLQAQVRFAGDGNLSAGNVNGVNWNGANLQGFPDILDSDVWVLTLEDLLWVTGQFTTPKWATDVFGGNNPLQWKAGFTSGQDALLYASNVGLRRRNSQAGATGLTA
jgi:hypothetical protein